MNPVKDELCLIIIKKEDNMIDGLKSQLLNHSKICFVIVNNIYSKLVGAMKNNNIPVNQFYFIDTLSSDFGDAMKNCEFITPDIKKILTSVEKAVASKKCDLIVIDNINSLLSYHTKNEVEKMINDLKTNQPYTRKVFFSQRNEITKDEEESFLKDLTLFADNLTGIIQ